MRLFNNLKKLDWLLIFCLAVLSVVSLVVLEPYDNSLFQKQIIWYVIGFLIIIFGSQINWYWIIKWPVFKYGFYAASILFLIVSNVQSHLVRGTKSWLTLGPFQFEPAEFAKLGLIFLLAGFFTNKYLAAWRSKYLFTSLGLAILPAALTAIHPDLGSAIIIMSIWVGFIFIGGVNKKRLVIGLLAFLLIAVLIWMFFLKSYQKERISAFLSPGRDPLGINYNVIQAKIAIGSAGFWGKGFGQGTQTEFHFLPEAQTDFIFAAFSEEWGMLGDFVLMLTFMVIFYRLMNIGLRAESNSFKFLVFGGSVVLLVQIIINIGSNIGLLPVTGITLPFVSYGGSSVLTIAVLISIIQHIKLESSR
ncbi:rod shape-determining protein RodA [Patescibacteria group bacterium]|nr:rod shape-determining protein RodA [Patescibacteria group bacterium]